MIKLLVLKGLPASGKSTYARELANKGWVRTNKDDLRVMLHNGRYNKSNESIVIGVRDSIVYDGLRAGRNVVVDDTNFHPSHTDRLQAIALELGVGYEEKFFDIDVDEAIKRDLARPVTVGEKVIRKMYDQYIRPPHQPLAPNPKLPWAIICDIDGTLAHMVDRGPYDPTNYAHDTVDPIIRDLVQAESAHGTKVLIVSGRDDTYKQVTGDWLDEKGVPYDHLYMRPMANEPDHDNKRKDYLVKRELFDTFIRGKYNVKYVLDDRDQVVREWRALGLKCLQVAEGAF